MTLIKINNQNGYWLINGKKYQEATEFEKDILDYFFKKSKKMKTLSNLITITAIIYAFLVSESHDIEALTTATGLLLISLFINIKEQEITNFFRDESEDKTI
ncbi:hypothetical protein [Riemerella anatipestifer]|nr:hypothetical protein [Riemerella anatipestifer]